MAGNCPEVSSKSFSDVTLTYAETLTWAAFTSLAALSPVTPPPSFTSLHNLCTNLCVCHLIHHTWTCVNWLFCPNFNRTRQSIERKLPLGEWEESVFPYKKRDRQRGRGRQTDKDRRDLAFIFSALSFWSVDSFIFRCWICVWGRKLKLWHSKSISQTASVYFRIMLQEISPHTESEVMTHKRSVPVQYRNLNTPLLQPGTNKGCFIFPAGKNENDRWIMCDKCGGSWLIIHLFI